MPLTYREMVCEDLPAAFEVRLSTVENDVTMEELAEDYGVTPSSLAESMQTSVKGWLCEDDDRVVGFAMADRWNGEVQVVAVLPSHEGRGIGKTLLDRVVDWLLACGCDEVWLLANPDPHIRATGFYEKLGWHATGEKRGGDHVLRFRRGPQTSGQVT